MQQSGFDIPDPYIIFGDFEFSGGVMAMKQLLALPNPPHGVFTSNDAMAVGVYGVISSRSPGGS